MSDPASLQAVYDTVYGTELVYVKDCWQQCGDAHCCNFQRYKSRYRLIGQTAFQELPLLPGEFDYLRQRGWTRQFEPFEHRVQPVEIAGRRFAYEAIVSRRPGCACDHATRPTICRLYPLLPVFDLEGALVGVEPTGIYEAMEQIGGLAPACRLQGMPFAQLGAFLTLCAALGRSPRLRWHLEAYRLAKAHAAERLAQRVQQTGKDVFAAFEGAYLRGAVFDTGALAARLSRLVDEFDRRWPGWCPPATDTPPSEITA